MTKKIFWDLLSISFSSAILFMPYPAKTYTPRKTPRYAILSIFTVDNAKQTITVMITEMMKCIIINLDT